MAGERGDLGGVDLGDFGLLGDLGDRGDLGEVRALVMLWMRGKAVDEGASERRRPICTVALLAALLSRLCLRPKKGRGGNSEFGVSSSDGVEIGRASAEAAVGNSE